MTDINKFQLLYDLNECDNTIKNVQPDTHTQSDIVVEEKSDETELKYEKHIIEQDNFLNTKKQIKIYYTINKNNKAESFERVFNVVGKQTYENIKRLISRYKTHKNNKINWDEQKNKISLTNNLMSMCYKDPVQKCTFIYPVVIITLKNGKTLTKNYIREGSLLQFTINDIVYNINKNTVPNQ